MRSEYLEVNSELLARSNVLEKYLEANKPNGTCIYVGLGTGTNIPLLLTHFDQVTIVEPDRQLINRFSLQTIHQRHKTSFIEGKLEDLHCSFYFDSIFLIACIEHISDIDKSLLNISRVSKPNSDIILIFNNPLSLHRQLGVATGHINSCFELTLEEGPHGHGHYKLYTLESVLELLASINFLPVSSFGFYVKPLPTALVPHLPTSVIQGFMGSFEFLPHELHAYTFLHARKSS